MAIPPSRSGRGSPFAPLKRSLSVGCGPARSGSKDASGFPGLMRTVSGTGSPACLPDGRSPLAPACLRRASSRDNIQRGSPQLVSHLRRASSRETPPKIPRVRSRPAPLIVPSSPEQQETRHQNHHQQQPPQAQTLKVVRTRPRPTALVIPSSPGGAQPQESPTRAQPRLRPSALILPPVDAEPAVQQRGPAAQRIRPGLMLGSEQFAKSRACLQQERITHILNCARGDNFFEQEGRVQYMKLGLTETTEDLQTMQQTLECSVRFIQEAVQEGGEVLVHCRQGKNRSCTMVIAFLMWSEKKTAEEAFEEVRSIRAEADPSLAYWMELSTWERTCLGQSSPQPLLLPDDFGLLDQADTAGSPELLAQIR